jgi:predicted transcriptional regulator
MNDNDAKALIDELAAVKKLLILQLLAAGIKQKQIAQMLGVSEATMSRMLPKGLANTISAASS